MSIYWIIVILIGVTWILWAVDLIRGRYPRKLTLKDWFNCTVWTFGTLLGIASAIGIFLALGFTDVVAHSSLDSNLDFYTRELAMGISAGSHFIAVGLLLLGLIALLWILKSDFESLALWKYSTDEVEFKKKLRKDRKEKARERLPVFLFRFMYPDRKRKEFKHPRVAKFFLLDQFQRDE